MRRDNSNVHNQRGDYSIRIYVWVSKDLTQVVGADRGKISVIEVGSCHLVYRSENFLRLSCHLFFSEMATIDFNANLKTTTAPRQRWRDTTGSKSTADRKGIHY